MVSKTAVSFALVPSPNSKRVLSSSPFFSAGVKCSHKPLPALRLSLQVPPLNS